MHLAVDELVGLGLEQSAADHICRRVRTWEDLDPAARWGRLSTQVLSPDHPFAVHHLLFERNYATWDPEQGPPPAWIPAPEQVAKTHIQQLMADLGLASYAQLHAWSTAHREVFWEEIIGRLGIRFQEPYRAVRDPESGPESPRWLPGARLNLVESCFQADPRVPAVVHDDAEGRLHIITYRELLTLTDQVVGGLAALGLKPGDAIAVDLPMTPEAVAVYLGIIKAGCVSVSIADSLAPTEIRTRLELGRARAIFTQDHLARGARRLPLYDKVMAAEAPRAVVLPCGVDLDMPLRAGDLGWRDFLGPVAAAAAVARDPDDILSILFSSGTTGAPKAIPWTQTTPLRCAADGWLHHDIHPGERVAWPTSLGWMMGPWLIFASLINRATLALSCHAPSGRAFGRFVRDARVNVLGVVPSLVRIWRTSECMAGLDWSAIKAFSSTGECSNSRDMLFLMSRAGYKPVIEYCGGTEIGGAYITGTLVQPAAPATFSTPALGLDLRILDAGGHHVSRGEVFIVPPSIGLSNRLLGADHHQVYHAGVPRSDEGLLLRRHGDEMERLGGGYFRAHGRVDDTMNLHGIKVSAAEIERAVATVEGIHDAAAVAVSPAGGGPDELVVYVTLENGITRADRALKASVQRALRTQLSAMFKVSEVRVVETLPRTASNKIMRRMLRGENAPQRGT